MQFYFIFLLNWKSLEKTESISIWDEFAKINPREIF